MTWNGRWRRRSRVVRLAGLIRCGGFVFHCFWDSPEARLTLRQGVLPPNISWQFSGHRWNPVCSHAVPRDGCHEERGLQAKLLRRRSRSRRPPAPVVDASVDMTFRVTCRHSRASSIRILRNTRLSAGEPNRQQSFETHRAPVGTKGVCPQTSASESRR